MIDTAKAPANHAAEFETARRNGSDDGDLTVASFLGCNTEDPSFVGRVVPSGNVRFGSTRDE